MKKSRIWMDGRWYEWEDANIHVMTHSLHYGSAVFEGIRSYYNEQRGRAVFRLREHVERLFYSANLMGLSIQYSKEEMMDVIKAVVKSFDAKEGYIRPLIFFGQGLGLYPKNLDTHVMVGAIEWGKYLGKGAVRVMVSRWRRISSNITDPRAKVSGHYVNSILATKEAKDKGFDEAIMLDENGYVAEGPGENIFLVEGDTLVVVSSESILPGITRDTIITIAKDLGIKVVKKKVSFEELLDADEVFFCGTAAEVTPIVEVNGKLINAGTPGKITEQISQTFYKEVRGEGKHSEWVHYVET